MGYAKESQIKTRARVRKRTKNNIVKNIPKKKSGYNSIKYDIDNWDSENDYNGAKSDIFNVVMDEIKNTKGRCRSRVIPEVIIMATGNDLHLAVFISHVLFQQYFIPTGRNYFSKTNEAWKKECCLTAHKLRKCIKYCQDKGFIKVWTKNRKVDGQFRNYPTRYKLELMEFYDWFEEALEKYPVIDKDKVDNLEEDD